MSAIARHAKPRVLEALSDTRIVVIQGARQVGKTTLIQEIVDERGGRLASLDDPLNARAAREDPVGFLDAVPDRLLAIDEVQRAPELILALKYVVDRDTRPGRFLLTGSANLLKLPAIEDSLAGRTESIELHGFSQGELAGHTERFVDRVMAGERFADHDSELHRRDYLERATAGSYPEALARTAGRRRDQWLDNYVNSIVRREADDVSNLQRVAELPHILRVLAARNSGELNVADVARDTGIPTRTLTPYLELLHTSRESSGSSRSSAGSPSGPRRTGTAPTRSRRTRWRHSTSSGLPARHWARRPASSRHRQVLTRRFPCVGRAGSRRVGGVRAPAGAERVGL
jgi:predicted AAA+ superfamily ATPase